MAIFQECPNCKRLCGIQPSVKFCPKCQTKLPKLRSYVVEWRIPDENGHLTKKKKKTLGKCPLDQARAFEAEQRKYRSEEGPNGTAKPPEQTWEDVVERFMKRLEVEGAGPTYVKDSRLYLNRMSDFWGRRTPVKDIHPHMIQDFRLSLREKDRPLSMASCDRHLAAGKAAWRYSVDNLPNPFSKVRQYNPDNEVTRYLSNEERNRLLAAALKVSQHLYEIVVVALSTGLRKANILNLRRDHVNFEKGVIQIRQKGDRPHTVYLPPELAEMLQAIPDNGTPWFWISKKTGKPYDRDWRRPWFKAKTLAGIDSAFRFHDLRHDAGTAIYRASGRDLKTAQRFLGHRQLQTTLRYAHLPDGDLIDSVNSISPLKTSSSTSAAFLPPDTDISE